MIAGTLGILMALLAPPVSAADLESDTPLDCLKCHTRVLASHDKLGSGTEACWVCHDNTHMGKLHLFDGTIIPLSENPKLCQQCHPGQYSNWQENKHGAASLKQEQPGTALPQCAQCHDPHQPQMTPHDRDITTVPPTAGADELDCLSCHVRTLESHDVLGSGSEACWSCHYNKEMGVFHLAGGNQIPVQSYMVLCGQCHQERYQAWENGTHGVPSWNDEAELVPGTARQGCTGCHNPHKPQIAFTNITRPHPEPAPLPPPLPAQPLMMLGISILLTVAGGVAVARQGAG